MIKKILLFILGCALCSCVLIGMEQDLLNNWKPIVDKKSSLELASLITRSQLIGPCETNLSGIEIYASIDNNLTVTLYARKLGSVLNQGYSITFNPLEIIAMKTEASKIDLSDFYSAAKKNCDMKNLYTISQEANNALKKDLGAYNLNGVSPKFIEIFNWLVQKAYLAEYVPCILLKPNAKNPLFLCKKRGCNAIIEVSSNFLKEKSDNEQVYTLANVLMYLKQVYLKNGDDVTIECIADIATVLLLGGADYSIYLHGNDRSDFRKALMLVTFECFKKSQWHFSALCNSSCTF